MPSHRQPTAGFWISVALVAELVGYPLSLGPACWLADRSIISDKPVATMFLAILDFAFKRDSAAALLLNWWTDIGARREGAARRITCRTYADEIGCGTIDGCDFDDFES